MSTAVVYAAKNRHMHMLSKSKKQTKYPGLLSGEEMKSLCFCKKKKKKKTPPLFDNLIIKSIQMSPRTSKTQYVTYLGEGGGGKAGQHVSQQKHK